MLAKLFEIWTAFRDVFWLYMIQLEKGIENRWPQNWWRVLIKLAFLVKQRYNKLEPFYYIVQNKVLEEAERCKELDVKIRNLKKEITLEKRDPIFEHGNHNLRICVKPLHPIQALALIKAVRNNPAIYMPGYNTTTRKAAWDEVAKQVMCTAYVCRKRFQRLYTKYRLHASRDTKNQCSFTLKLYSDLKYIYSCVHPETELKLKIRTPSEVNQLTGTFENTRPIIKNTNAEEFLPLLVSLEECNGETATRTLIDIVGQFSSDVQEAMETDFENLFQKYRAQSQYQ